MSKDMKNKLSPEERESAKRRANNCWVLIAWIILVGLATAKLINDYYNR